MGFTNEEIEMLKKPMDAQSAQVWRRAFEKYNQSNFKKLSMGCAPCFAKVAYYIIKNNIASE